MGSEIFSFYFHFFYILLYMNICKFDIDQTYDFLEFAFWTFEAIFCRPIFCKLLHLPLYYWTYVEVYLFKLQSLIILTVRSKLSSLFPHSLIVWILDSQPLFLYNLNHWNFNFWTFKWQFKLWFSKYVFLQTWKVVELIFQNLFYFLTYWTVPVWLWRFCSCIIHLL
jgi:hypothetical protein